jgi:hypothetical protein
LVVDLKVPWIKVRKKQMLKLVIKKTNISMSTFVALLFSINVFVAQAADTPTKSVIKPHSAIAATTLTVAQIKQPFIRIYRLSGLNQIN